MVKRHSNVVMKCLLSIFLFFLNSAGGHGIPKKVVLSIRLLTRSVDSSTIGLSEGGGGIVRHFHIFQLDVTNLF